jgi:hypothetical protein
MAATTAKATAKIPAMNKLMPRTKAAVTESQFPSRFLARFQPYAAHANDRLTRALN